jgi:hypothetical protein
MKILFYIGLGLLVVLIANKFLSDKTDEKMSDTERVNKLIRGESVPGFVDPDQALADAIQDQKIKQAQAAWNRNKK